MELPIENLNETTPLAYESRVSSSLLPLDPNETLDLHRAINGKQLE